jgi:hypothetical protein
VGPVGEVLEAPLRLAASAVLSLRLGKLDRDLGDQPGVLGQAEEIVDLIVFAPGHQVIAGEAGIRPQQNAYLGPGLADPGDDPRHLLDRAGAGIDIGLAQPGAEEMPPAKDI